jgi:hypothetical protein
MAGTLWIWILLQLPPLPTLQRWFREGKADSVYTALQADTGKPASRLVYRMILQMMLVYRQEDSLEMYLPRFRSRLRCPTCFAPLAFELARRRGEEEKAFREAWTASREGRNTALLVRYLQMLPSFRDPRTRVQRLEAWLTGDPTTRLDGVLALLDALGEGKEALRLALRYTPGGPWVRRLLARYPHLARTPPPATLPRQTLVGVAWRVRAGIWPVDSLWKRFPPQQLPPDQRVFLLRFLPPDARWSARLVHGIREDQLPSDAAGPYLMHAIAAGGGIRDSACRSVGDRLDVNVLWTCAEALRREHQRLADTLYARLIRRNPTSVLALRALWRLQEEQDTVLPSPPFARLSTCTDPFCLLVHWWRQTPGQKPPEEIRREMERWILDHPDHPFAPLVRAWWERGVPASPPLRELDTIPDEGTP